MLIEHMPAIQAEERSYMIQAVSAPHMKASRYRAFVNSLRQVATKVIRAAEPLQKIEVIEENPDKAAEWLAGQGVKLIDKKDG